MGSSSLAWKSKIHQLEKMIQDLSDSSPAILELGNTKVEIINSEKQRH